MLASDADQRNQALEKNCRHASAGGQQRAIDEGIEDSAVLNDFGIAGERVQQRLTDGASRYQLAAALILRVLVVPQLKFLLDNDARSRTGDNREYEGRIVRDDASYRCRFGARDAAPATRDPGAENQCEVARTRRHSERGDCGLANAERPASALNGGRTFKFQQFPRYRFGFEYRSGRVSGNVEELQYRVVSKRMRRGSTVDVLAI